MCVFPGNFYFFSCFNIVSTHYHTPQKAKIAWDKKLTTTDVSNFWLYRLHSLTFPFILWRCFILFFFLILTNAKFLNGKKITQKARLTFSLSLVHCDKHENKEQKDVDVISMLHVWSNDDPEPYRAYCPVIINWFNTARAPLDDYEHDKNKIQTNFLF